MLFNKVKLLTVVCHLNKQDQKRKQTLIKNFLKPTIPEASHRGISPVSFWPRGQKPKFYILPHPELRKGNSDLPQGEVKFGNPEGEP